MDSPRLCVYKGCGSTPRSSGFCRTHSEKLQSLIEWIIQYPSSPQRLADLADFYYKIQNFPKAEELWKRASEFETNFRKKGLWINNMATAVYNQQERRIEARQLIRQAIDIYPSFGTAHLNYGRWSWEQGDYVQAEEHLRVAAELLDNDADAQWEFGWFLNSLLKKPHEAQIFLKRAVELKPGPNKFSQTLKSCERAIRREEALNQVRGFLSRRTR